MAIARLLVLAATLAALPRSEASPCPHQTPSPVEQIVAGNDEAAAASAPDLSGFFAPVVLDQLALVTDSLPFLLGATSVAVERPRKIFRYQASHLCPPPSSLS